MAVSPPGCSRKHRGLVSLPDDYDSIRCLPPRAPIPPSGFYHSSKIPIQQCNQGSRLPQGTNLCYKESLSQIPSFPVETSNEFEDGSRSVSGDAQSSCNILLFHHLLNVSPTRPVAACLSLHTFLLSPTPETMEWKALSASD